MVLLKHRILVLTALGFLASKNADAFVPAALNQPSSARFASAISEATNVDVSIDYDSAAKLAYEEWRKQNNKGDFDDARFQVFKSNYETLTVSNVVAAKQARDNNSDEKIVRLELNEFADMTAEEYMTMQASSPTTTSDDIEEAIEESIDLSIDYDSTARLAYKDWRAKFGKGDYDEALFQTFKKNYETVAINVVIGKKIARETGSSASDELTLGEDADTVVMEVPSSSTSLLGSVMESSEAQSEAAAAIEEAAAALAEEEEILAQKLGLNSVEELEVALDSMEGIAADGSELDTTNISREARLRDAYMKWCKDFDKEIDELRFAQFTENYLAMEQYAKENNKEMELNKYADCSEKEYIELTTGKLKEEEDAKVAEAKAIEEAAATKKAEEAAKLEAEAKAKKAAKEAAAKQAVEEAEMKKKIEAEKKAMEAEAAQKAKIVAAEKQKVEDTKAAQKKRAAEKQKEDAARAKAVEDDKKKRQAAQEKAAAKAAADAESDAIALAKAIAEKEAAQVARRRQLDAEAADIAREKARKAEEKMAALRSAQTVKISPKKVEAAKTKPPAPTQKPAPVEVAPVEAVKVDVPKPAPKTVPATPKTVPAPKKAVFDFSFLKPKEVPKEDKALAQEKKAREAAAKAAAEAEAKELAKEKAEAEAKAKEEAAKAEAKAKEEAARAKAKAEEAKKPEISFGSFFNKPSKPEAKKSPPLPPSVPPPAVIDTPEVEIADPVTDAFASFFGTKKSTPEATDTKKAEIEPVVTPPPAKKEPFFSFGAKKVAPKNIDTPVPTSAPKPAAKKETSFSFGAKPQPKLSTPAPAPAAPKAKTNVWSTWNIAKTQPKKKIETPVPAPAPKPAAKKEPFFSFGAKPQPKVPVPTPSPAPKAKTNAWSTWNIAKTQPKKKVETPTPAPKTKTKTNVWSTWNIAKTQPKKKVETPTPAPKPIAKKSAWSTFNIAQTQPKKVVASKSQTPSPAPKPAAKPFFSFGAKPQSKPPATSKPSPAAPKAKRNMWGATNISKSQPKKSPAKPLRTIALKQDTPVKKPVPKKPLNDGIPILSNWIQESDGAITGNVSNTKKFRSGQKITTSPVRRGAKAGSVVVTSSGSKYRLN